MSAGVKGFGRTQAVLRTPAAGIRKPAREEPAMTNTMAVPHF
jgi:hypothetical protein